MCLAMSLSFVGCSKNNTNDKNLITREEAYNIYYDTIEKFVPEIMSEPQECDVEIKTRDEVIYKTKNLKVYIKYILV